MGYDYEILSSPYIRREKNVYIYELGGGISIYSTFGVVGDYASQNTLNPDQENLFTHLDNNVFLLKKDNSYVMFDAGVGDDINTASRIKVNFEDIGINLSDIEFIVMTHLHHSHSIGLTVGTPTVLGGKPERKYPKAKIFIPKRELDFWQKKMLADGEASPIYYEKLQWTGINSFFEFDASVVKDMLNVYGEDIVVFDEEITSSQQFIKKIDIFGHTPGHTAYLIKGSERQVIIAGDFVNHAPVQIDDTSIPSQYDYNIIEATKSREMIMKFAAENNITLCASRATTPGFLKIIEK